MTGRPIGTVAKATGVKIPTIRFYENIGLLPAPPRSEGNRRLYDEATADRLHFIRHARELGFEIESIRGLLRLADSPEAPCHDADEIARTHLDAIDRKIASLVSLRAEVARMAECACTGPIAECRVIEVLAEHGHEH
ncbi:MAG: helix-turn-helix domain-containing protein [Bauldia sp.]|nr:helix-turn-helix domain-containing protein [Bauldia sp.]